MGRKSKSLQSSKAVMDTQEINLAILTSIPRFTVYLAVGLILFWMPLYIDVDLKHVFNTAKEIQFGRFLMLALVSWLAYLCLRGEFLFPKSKAWYFYLATIIFMILSVLGQYPPICPYVKLVLR